MGNIIERRNSRNGPKTQSKRCLKWFILVMTKGSIPLASGAGHLSARPNLDGFTWKGLTGLLLAEGPNEWGPGEVLPAS